MSDIPVIKLGTREWKCPPLVPRQQAIVIGACVRFNKMLTRIVQEPETFTGDDYNLALTIVFFGCIQKQDPAFTMDMLKDLDSCTWEQLIAAAGVVQDQTQMFKRTVEAEAGASGEATAPKKSSAG